MPILSGFLPIPLAMMIPFMGAQSLVIGKQFGEGFQYGKRKISAMSNEEFNKMTPQKLAQDNAAELRQMIPSMQKAITDMRSFQSFIVRELIETAKQLPGDIFGGLTGTNNTPIQTSTSFSTSTPTQIAYAGSIGPLNALLKGLKPGTKQWQDTKDLIDQLLSNAGNIVQNRTKKLKLTPFTSVPKPPSAAKVQRLSIQSIKKSSNDPNVTRIATDTANMVLYIANMKKATKKNVRLLNQKVFLQTAKKYNQFVLSNRQFGKKYRIDTAASIKNKKLTYG